ncbi:MAG TPA: EAL domain-containing protein [Vicinamibacteria bacterium]|nr:EAL domain-containing protein [Vicinamibacteria bacterium]
MTLSGSSEGEGRRDGVPVPYRERVEDLRRVLVAQGSLGLLLIDTSALAQVEHQYGTSAFEKVMAMARDLVVEVKGQEVRHEDIICLNDRGGDAFLVFFAPKRREGPLKIADLKAAAQRVEGHLNRKLVRLASPYLEGNKASERLGAVRRVTVGFALCFFNPLVMPERLVTRLVDEAWSCVLVQRAQRELQSRCDLQEVLLTDDLSTVFQPIVDLRSREVLGYEALSRGPAGSVYQMPLRLFAMAEEADLVFELDRKCRCRALAAATSIPARAKLFVNVVPPAMWDPEFQGAALVRLAEAQGLTPDRVVLEITERSAIENYALFADQLSDLTRYGFSIAVDDVGAGYSGLEKIAHLNPHYLKFDIELVRNIDSSYIRREMTRALKSFADSIGSTIIAEGIERDGELKTLLDLGIQYGQGFLLGRPAPAFQAPALASAVTAAI